MTGLEKIVQEILDEAESAAQQTVSCRGNHETGAVRGTVAETA